MRGCRDQVLSLVLLGQMEILKKSSGLMVAFIDFSKAYNRIDRGKLWKSLETMGVSGKFSSFLQLLYAGTSCQAKVGDRQSEVLNVNAGLHQGCACSLVLVCMQGLGNTTACSGLLILPVMCKCCMGPIYALVPMGMVHLNND